MRVLIACEHSGIVRDAFLSKGHDAISCDILPTEREGPHIQGNIFSAIDSSYDLMIAFPPCTFLSVVSANRWKEPYRINEQIKAFKFVLDLYSAPIERIAIENPVGFLNTNWRKPDQIINPWMFGHTKAKRTCLWLKNLPPLMASLVCTQRQSWVNLVPSSRNQWKIRSRTFEGVARAMSEQWRG